MKRPATRISNCLQRGKPFGYITNTKINSTQPSIPSGYINREPACLAETKWGTFTCVGWQVTLCDHIWQMTLISSLRWVSYKELHNV